MAQIWRACLLAMATSTLPNGSRRASSQIHSCSGVARSVATAWARCKLLRARSEEHTSELQSLMRISYAVFCLKKKNNKDNHIKTTRRNHTTKHTTTDT